jgi:hypothetical protein
LAGDAVALRQWASVAVAELAALKLGERHAHLQLAGLANENERLERALGDALHDKRTVTGHAHAHRQKDMGTHAHRQTQKTQTDTHYAQRIT